MNKSITFLLLFLLYGTVLFAQDAIPVGEWLDQRLEALLPAGANPGATFRPGWVRELEFRTETEDLELAKQEYLLRFSPSTPRIRRAEARLMGLLRQEVELSRREFRTEVTKYVLEELLEVRRLRAELAVKERLLTVYRDEVTYLRGTLTGDRYNVKDLLQAEAAVRELELDVETRREQLRSLTGEGPPPATAALLGPGVLEARLLATDWQAIRAALPGEEHLELAQAQSEAELERAKQYRLIDFVQVRYNGPHNDLLPERLNLGLGFDLPTSSGSRLDLEELRVEQLLLEQEITQQRTLDSLQVAGRLTGLRTRLARYRRLSDDLARQSAQLDRLLATGADPAYDSPELYLFQQEAVLERELDVLEVEAEVYRAYLELLEEAGVLGGESGLEGVLSFWVE